jgi:hypothetical protein
MKSLRLSESVVCALLICLVLHSSSLAGKPPDPDEESRLYHALLKVDSSAKLWVGEDYGEIYMRFSQSLSAAEIPYKKLLKSRTSNRGRMLFTIYEDYVAAHDFLKAYLNDKAVIMRTNRFFEPTYLLERDAWPARLEERFPGLIAAIKEKDENGEFIEGRRALDFIFARVHDRLQSLYPEDASSHSKVYFNIIRDRYKPERTKEHEESPSLLSPRPLGEGEPACPVGRRGEGHSRDLTNKGKAYKLKL